MRKIKIAVAPVAVLSSIAVTFTIHIEATSSFTNQAASLAVDEPSFTAAETCSYAYTTGCNPYGVAFDSTGNLWVSDETLARAFKFTTSFFKRRIRAGS